MACIQQDPSVLHVPPGAARLTENDASLSRIGSQAAEGRCEERLSGVGAAGRFLAYASLDMPEIFGIRFVPDIPALRETGEATRREARQLRGISRGLKNENPGVSPIVVGRGLPVKPMPNPPPNQAPLRDPAIDITISELKRTQSVLREAVDRARAARRRINANPAALHEEDVPENRS